MRPYRGSAEIVATGPANSNWGGGWCIMDSIKYGVDDSILVTYQDLDGHLYNAHWCRIHTDFKSGHSYINIHRRKYYIDDFLWVAVVRKEMEKLKMEKIVNEMKKYGINLPAVGAGTEEIEKAYYDVSRIYNGVSRLPYASMACHRAFDYLERIKRQAIMKECIGNRIKTYGNVLKCMDYWPSLFSACTVDGKAWNKTIEKKLILLIEKYFDTEKNGLRVCIRNKPDYSRFEIYLESGKYYEEDDRYIRVDIVSIYGKDYDRLFIIPDDKVRPVFVGAVANADMMKESEKLKKDMEKLKYSLMYGESVIKQINSYMEIVNRLYNSCPYDYWKIYGNKIKKVYFY